MVCLIHHSFFLFQAIEKRHRLSRCVTPKRQDFHYRFPRGYDADMFSRCGIKIPPTVIVCGYQPPLRYVVRRKSTTNSRTMQIIREKNANSLKFIPIFGGERGFFPYLYICNEMKYIEYIYYFLYVMQKQCNCINNRFICIVF